MTYRTYTILVKHVGFVEVMACSPEAAVADLEQAYYQPEVITMNAGVVRG
ncbi:hypothetical protein [uncultured Paludibaculum sp.]|nr:hypothetical protein [uncultured Paludibaculum sp.]